MSDATFTRAGVQPIALSLLRFVAGLAFMEHGLSKLFGFPAPVPAGLPVPILVPGLIETIGGFLVCIGLLSRPAAFIMSGEMAIGYFMEFAPKSFFPILSGGDGALLYCFIFLYIAAAGGGAWSLDRVIAGPRSWLAGTAAA